MDNAPVRLSDVQAAPKYSGHAPVLFDFEKFRKKMQDKVDINEMAGKIDKAIAYDSAAEYALDCIIYKDGVK